MSQETAKLFVYGTLRRGFTLHRYLRKNGMRFLGKGNIRARLYDLGRFPGALPSQSSAGRVQGEVYELNNPEEQLRELDALEEFYPKQPEKNLFVRRLTDVKLESGQRCKAWAYFLAKRPANARPLPWGDYSVAHPSAQITRAQR